MNIYSTNGYDPTKSSVFNFYGLNRTRRTSKGEFSDMENMSTLEYPCAAPRGKRLKVVSDIGDVQLALPPLVSDTAEITGFTGIANEKFYYNGEVVSGKYILRSSWHWSGVIMGNVYIINGVSADKTENIMYSYERASDTFAIMGAYMDKLIVTINADTNGCYFENFRYCYADEHGDINFGEYAITLPDGTQMTVSDFFVKYAGAGAYSFPVNNFFKDYFKVGDEITVAGFPSAPQAENTQLFTYSTVNGMIPQTISEYRENNTLDMDTVMNITEIDEYTPVRVVVKSFASTKTSAGIYGSTRNLHRMYVSVYNKNGKEISLIDMDNIYCIGVKLSLKKPALSQICTHNGRIFGTHTNGRYIYGSSSDLLYDFSADSRIKGLAARLTDFTPGHFTGICEYGNLLLAFKEQSITIIGGDNPENYYTDVINGIGCIAPQSIAVTHKGVIFLSYNGFYIFSGNTPQCISQKLNTKYKSAVAGFDGEIYYVSAVRSDTDKRELLTFDLNRSLWHKQDALDVLGYFRFKGKFYLVHKDEDMLSYISETNSTDETAPSVQWSFTSVLYHDNTLDLKALENLHFRVELEKGAYFIVYSRCDDGEYKIRERYSEPGRNVFPCPIKTEMGHTYQYKIVGGGNVVFFEIETDKAFGGRDTRLKSGTVDYVQERKKDVSEFDLL